MSWLEGYNYLVYARLLALGIYAIIGRRHLVKKVIGLGVLQTGAFLFFISLAAVRGGTAPIIEEGTSTYMNPLPHVLILTAIVVGVSTMSVGLALCIRIRQEWGTCETDEIARRESE